MSETIDIPPFEHGVVRVLAGRFASEEALKAYAAPEGAAEGAPWPLRDELGAEALDPRGVEAFAMDSLRGMGLPGYLRMAYGVSERDASDPALREVEGHAVLLSSRALEGRAARLRIPERLRYLGAFRDADAHAAPGPAPALPRARGEAEGSERGARAGAPPPEPAAPPRRRLGAERAAGAGALALGALLVGAGVVGNDWWLWLPGLALAAAGAAAAARWRRKASRRRPGR